MKRFNIFLIPIFIILFVTFFVSAQGITQGISNPQGVAVDSAGSIYVADTGNHQIIKINSAGESVFAGTGTAGDTDGAGNIAQFDNLHKIMFGPSGDLYVADTGNNKIKKISPSGVVSTVAGTGTAGYSNSGDLTTGVELNGPKGLFVTTLGEVMVADTGNHRIRLINEANNNIVDVAGTGNPGSVSCSISSCSVATTASCSSFTLNSPQDIVVSTIPLNNGEHYYETFIVDTGNHGIWGLRYESSQTICNGKWISGSGSPGYKEGSSIEMTEYDSPTAIDALGYVNGPVVGTYTSVFGLWIVDSGNHVIRAFDAPTFSQTTPFVGIPGQSGSNNGDALFYAPPIGLQYSTPNPIAKLNAPVDIFVDKSVGYNVILPFNFIIADSGNDKLRKLEKNYPPFNGIYNVLDVVPGQTSCSNQDDIIFKISGSTNAHGEEYNAGSYPEEICYSSVFGQIAPVNPDRTCSGGNQEEIVTLSGSTNAHAEISGSGNYISNSIYSLGTSICYEGLNCRSVGSGNGCDSGEVEVVKLSGSTNAHLELPGSGNYGTSICCTAPSLSELFWKRFDGNLIPVGNPNPICVGQSVKAFASSGGIGQVTIEIWEDDILGDDLIKTIVGVIDANGNIEGDWTITQADYDLGKDGLENSELEFYFVVNPGSSTSKTSYNLEPVVDDVSQCQSPKPTGGIKGPTHRGLYFLGNTVTFESDCVSSVGSLTYDWKITQGTEIYSETAETFDLMLGSDFGGKGQVDIALTCTDINGLKAQEQVSILVSDPNSDEFLTYIEQPGFSSVSENNPPLSGAYFPTEVDFSALDTYVVQVGSGCSGTCLAGDCPTQSVGIPSGCSSEMIISNSLTGNQYDSLTFDWEFWDDNNWNEGWNNFEGDGVTSGAIQYDSVSNSIGDSHMSVSISPSSNSQFTGSARIERDFTIGRCLDDGNKLLVDVVNGITENTVTDLDACLGGDDIQGTADDCCPSGQSCLSNGNGRYNCQFPTITTSVCSDFNSVNFPGEGNAKSECNGNSDPRIPANSVGSSNACEYAECSWNDDTGVCGVQVIQYSQTTNGCDLTPGACVVSGCSYDIQQTECINGQKTISYTTLSSSSSLPICGGAQSCDKPDIVVPCGKLSFELPFFGIVQFIGTFLIVMILYLTFGMKKRKRNKNE